jgi:hypothetical protein
MIRLCCCKASLAAWTLAKLKNVRQQGKRILVIGALFYDNIHLVNND